MHYYQWKQKLTHTIGYTAMSQFNSDLFVPTKSQKEPIILRILYSDPNLKNQRKIFLFILKNCVFSHEGFFY